MKSTELIIGQYYHISLTNGNFFIGKNEGPEKLPNGNVDEERISGPIISNMNTSEFEYLKYCNGFVSDGRKVRLATWDEIKWLETCIYYKQFIPKDEIKLESNYEIY